MSPQAPAYSPSSIVNAASNEPGPLAPNGIATIYGKDLAFITRSLQPTDVRDGRLPTALTGAGVRVLIANIPAFLYFVSPGQVNFLVPGNLRPGSYELQLTLEGRAGPLVPVEVAPSSPALFVRENRLAIATRPDGSLVDKGHPALPGEVVILHATGLGATRPAIRAGELAREPAELERMDDFEVTLNDIPLPRANLLYAGLAPGFAGLYQINCMLPPSLPADPEIRVKAGQLRSPERIVLPVATQPPAAASDR